MERETIFRGWWKALIVGIVIGAGIEILIFQNVISENSGQIKENNYPIIQYLIPLPLFYQITESIRWDCWLSLPQRNCTVFDFDGPMGKKAEFVFAFGSSLLWCALLFVGAYFLVKIAINKFLELSLRWNNRLKK